MKSIVRSIVEFAYDMGNHGQDGPIEIAVSPAVWGLLALELGETMFPPPRRYTFTPDPEPKPNDESRFLPSGYVRISTACGPVFVRVRPER